MYWVYGVPFDSTAKKPIKVPPLVPLSNICKDFVPLAVTLFCTGFLAPIKHFETCVYVFPIVFSRCFFPSLVHKSISLKNGWPAEFCLSAGNYNPLMGACVVECLHSKILHNINKYRLTQTDQSNVWAAFHLLTDVTSAEL